MHNQEPGKVGKFDHFVSIQFTVRPGQYMFCLFLSKKNHITHPICPLNFMSSLVPLKNISVWFYCQITNSSGVSSENYKVKFYL